MGFMRTTSKARKTYDELDMELRKKMDELQTAMKFHNIEQGNLEHIEGEKIQKALVENDNIKALKECMDKQILPVLQSALYNMYHFAELKYNNNPNNLKTSFIPDEKFNRIEECLVQEFNSIAVNDTPFPMYLQSVYNSKTRENETYVYINGEDYKKHNRLMEVKVHIYHNNTIETEMPKEGYLYTNNYDKAYDYLFKGKYEDISDLEKALFNSACEYEKFMNKLIIHKAEELTNEIRADISVIDEKLSDKAPKLDFLSLCNHLEFNTGYNDVDDSYQVRIYKDTVYLLAENIYGAENYYVAKEIPIKDIMQGKVGVNVIPEYALEEAFRDNYHFEGLDEDLQDKLMEAYAKNVYSDWSKIIDDWNNKATEDNIVEEDTVKYYNKLCDWFNTNELMGINEEYLHFNIKEADGNALDVIETYLKDNDKEFVEEPEIEF